MSDGGNPKNRRSAPPSHEQHASKRKKGRYSTLEAAPEILEAQSLHKTIERRGLRVSDDKATLLQEDKTFVHRGQVFNILRGLLAEGYPDLTHISTREEDETLVGDLLDKCEKQYANLTSHYGNKIIQKFLETGRFNGGARNLDEWRKQFDDAHEELANPKDGKKSNWPVPDQERWGKMRIMAENAGSGSTSVTTSQKKPGSRKATRPKTSAVADVVVSPMGQV